MFKVDSNLSYQQQVILLSKLFSINITNKEMMGMYNVESDIDQMKLMIYHWTEFQLKSVFAMYSNFLSFPYWNVFYISENNIKIIP